jgi:UDP-N-acetylmuramyl tripeptide synthase
VTISASVLDSRRLTGPGLLLDRPGAVLDVRLDETDVERAIAAWHKAAGRLLAEVGWEKETSVSRRFPGGVSLALTAPVDGLYAATEINERAWEAAAAELARQPVVAPADVTALRRTVAEERNPTLVSLQERAAVRGLTFLVGEDQVSAGSGTGALVWAADALPDPATVDWRRAHDVPIALVTGSNGKTTVVRLLAEMVRVGGRTPGYTTTDGVTVGTRLVEPGDFSGPSGARMALRHPDVEVAILETARGGILRRGLAVGRADVAVITNVAEDHLGEFGIETLTQLADTKLVVAKALGDRGTIVLNADDPLLVERSARIRAPVVWFSLDPESPIVAGRLRNGGSAVIADKGSIVLARGERRDAVVPVGQVPIAFQGTADHNIANALAAVAAAAALGIGTRDMATALCRFGNQPGDNPGRANLTEVGGVRVLIDYAHNPHGMLALVGLAKKLPAERRLVMVGQAGDRSDAAIRELARAAWSLKPDHIVVKDMAEFLRGRAPGEVPELLASELHRMGARNEAVSRVGPDIEGVRLALEWARPGDLLVLAVHQDRQAVQQLLDRLQADQWRAGQRLPLLAHSSG